MAPFLVLLSTTPIVSIIAHFILYKRKRGAFLYRLIVASYVFLFIYILATFKSLSVGNDTDAYYAAFVRAKEAGFFDYKSIGFEIGFSLLLQIFSKMNLPFNVFLGFINIFTFAPIAWFISKKSPYPCLSCLLYICYSLLIFNLSGIRQSLAIGLGVLVFLSLDIKNSIVKYIVIVLLIAFATLVHSSAFVLIIIPICKFLKIKSKMYLLIFPIIIFFFLFSEHFYGFFFYYIVNQGTYAPGSFGGGGLFIVLFLLCFFVAMFNQNDKISLFMNSIFHKADQHFVFFLDKTPRAFQTSDYDSMTFLCVVLLFMQSFCRVNVNFPRFGFYFLPFLFVVIPQAISKNKSTIYRSSLYFSLLAFFAIYFLITLLKGDTLGVVPYYFI